MLFRLCRDLGILDVDAAAETLPADVMEEWIQFYAWERHQEQEMIEAARRHAG